MSAPIEIRSTPVSAIVRTVSKLTPPDTSSTARPPVILTASRIASKSKLSSRIDSRAVRQRRFQLHERFHFDLDRHARVERERRVHRRADAARRRDVIFLDQDAVVEREPLVRAAAHAHRVLLREPQAGQRLSRVEDARARAFDRIDESGASRSQRPRAIAGS